MNSLDPEPAEPNEQPTGGLGHDGAARGDAPTVGPAGAYVAVARVGAIADGQGAAFQVRGRMVAVFRRGSEYHAIDDFCPHMGAALSEGWCQDDVVTCPWHAWRFRITDGTWCDNPVIKIDSFAVRVQGDEIQVLVPDEKARE